MSSEIAAWLREQATEDGRRYAARLRRQCSPEYEQRLTEQLDRAKAELAILDLYEAQAAKASENAMEEDRAWALWPVIRLLASGYRRRPGWQEEWFPSGELSDLLHPPIRKGTPGSAPRRPGAGTRAEAPHPR